MDTEVLPSVIQHTMASSAVIAASILGLVGLMKTPLLGGVWQKLPWWAKPTLLIVLTTIAGFADALSTGQPWFLALGAALTGLGTAVTAHEWTSLVAEAKGK